MEERLDELLGMSREAGRLSHDLAHWEHQVAWGSSADRNLNLRRCREARKSHQRAEEKLARARDRFLAALPAEGSAP